MKPLVSIVIATFNRPQLLKKALNSAILQDYENLQIIVTDDGDGDVAAQICSDFNDARVTFVKNTIHAKSPNGNKNNGFDNAKGEFICLLDDDDEFFSDSAISECMEILEQGYECVFADCLVEIDGICTHQISGQSPYEKDGAMSKVDYHCGRITGEFFKLFSRKFIEDFRFDERSFGGENELYIRFFEGRVYYLKKPLYLYRIERADSATKNAAKHALKVAHAYLKTVNLTKEIASVHAPEFLALQYKMAAYYAKMGGDYALSFSCLIKSLRMKFNKEALVLLALFILPNSALSWLSGFRVKIKQRFGI
ncbi:glycosyltransferase family 2 protein [Campylobacter suis]|uniref:GalNAc(5)-diNAcBac-PP-undecaprenol beta-1,3-glucosyltransferase n=1 Tax=Campylobacter suis TaxID=2790657 RepID=A0ABM8Q7L6_9BACT|nr:glycosyltransferase family 2 protein [Campylobacter suis]CAD7288774.1 GalNAc(5)-diNAcBac-PP-undecaprenol beta-1,3-glucosyltransferase [Campylobacter suis]